MSASRTCAERNGSSEKSESSQRSSASPSSRSSSASRSRARRSAASSRANLVEPRRLAARLRRRDRQERRDAQRPEVEPLEDDGPGGDRAGGREPERGHRVGELGGRVGRLGLVRLELAPQLEHEQPVDVAAELRRHQALRLRPELRDLARDDRAQRDAAAEVGVGARPRARRPARARRRSAAVPNSVCSRSAYAASNASSCQSKPPQRSAVHVSIGRRIERKSASSPVSPSPACARAKIAAAGSRFRSSIALRASGSRRSVGACSSTKPRTSGRYS